jgi:membrane-bound lytic murein transglycosylase D
MRWVLITLIFFAAGALYADENTGGITTAVTAGPAAAGTQTQSRPQRVIRSEHRFLYPTPSPSSFLQDYNIFSSENSLLSENALNQPLTQRYIKQYSSPGGISWLASVMKRGSVYLPFIREEIAKRGLPTELAFLPVIESGYQSTARSRSGAVGLWQFMTNSIGPFDMKVNDLVDERRDFRKSTIGALRKLEENYHALGNWPLALAAYNAGLGGINRIVQRTKSRDYWNLSEQKELRSETIHYVPKLLAVAYIISQPRRFGLDLWNETVEWTTLPLERQAALDILAAEAGASRETLRLLNAELLHGITPADKNYLLKVPAADAARISEALKREDLKLLTFYRYVVKYGDTLSALSRHYGVSLGLIEQHNPGILNRYLKIGETVIIPAFQETAPYSGGVAGTGSGAQTGGSEFSFNGTHLVKKGETLWSLALAYEIDPQALAEANNMELNQILPEGKTLKVPGHL